MRRPAVTGILLAVLVAMAVGCGTARRAATSNASMAPSSEVSDYAQAVNLRAADVPSLRSGHLKSQLGTIDGPFGEAVEACDGARRDGEKIVGISSERFSRRNESHQGGGAAISLFPIEAVSSAVYVFPSAALAAREFASADGALARSCLIQAVESEPAVLGSDATNVKERLLTGAAVSALPSPLTHTAIYWLRTTGAFAIGAPGAAGRSRFYGDRFGFVIGRALVTLSAVGDPRPFPAATERRILALLHARGTAHRL